MPREIKFRVWDNKEKVITCNYEHQTEERLIISQYTGIQDSEGNDIYEGDILAVIMGDDSDKDRIKFKVIFTECSFCLQEICKIGKTFYNISTRSMARTLTIVGNIYQNPELLENK